MDVLPLLCCDSWRVTKGDFADSPFCSTPFSAFSHGKSLVSFPSFDPCSSSCLTPWLVSPLSITVKFFFSSVLRSFPRKGPWTTEEGKKEDLSPFFLFFLSLPIR